MYPSLELLEIASEKEDALLWMFNHNHELWKNVLFNLGSPGRLTVRFLTTIPSAAETSMQMEDEPGILVPPSKDREGPLYAILHSQPTTPKRRQSIVTLHPPEQSLPSTSRQNRTSTSSHHSEPGTSSSATTTITMNKSPTKTTSSTRSNSDLR